MTVKLDETLKQDLSWNKLKTMLTRAGLPLEYPTLLESEQKACRERVFSSWWDPKQPNVLVTNLEAYLQSHYLFVEFLLKPSSIGQGIYFFEDASNKYDMIRMVMDEPLDGRVNKSIVTATRRTGKTQGLIYEAMPHICITRPFSGCLLSEVEEKRTLEEIKKIKRMVERNERIHEEFGGEGVLFPRGNKDSWSAHELQFLHLPGNYIMGHSLGSAQRGRGPIYGVVDDPEDEKTTFNQKWRVDFFSKLLSVYCGMFTKGGKLCWIGTPIHGGSALSLAMKGKSEKEETGEQAVSDARFKDWRRQNFSVIQKDQEGNWFSHQPQRLSVPEFLAALEKDPITTKKEILCLPVTPGTKAFKYDGYQHGFMVCISTGDKYPKDTLYVLDLKTGGEWLYTDFLKRLKIVGAADPAPGASEDSDPAAAVFVGMDDTGTIYVLDAWANRVFEDVQIGIVYEIAEELKARTVAWEKTGLQITIARQAERHVEERKLQRRHAPEFVPVDNARKKKTNRILSMLPLFAHQEIRFRLMEPVQGDDGRVHTPAPFKRWGMYLELMAQVQEYTDQGIKGHDDIIDALEMAVRTASPAIVAELSEKKISVDDVLKKWNKLGIMVNRSHLPSDFQEEIKIPTRKGIHLPYV